ncbi:MAG: GGDEF domain-containing protein, partial [Siculibacillus sp.]|nr:GGDEF domain-containing protein [Siculibacillus sp.]
SAFVHLAVMVPLGFGVALVAAHVGTPWLREGTSAALTVVSVATILWVYLISETPSAAHYHYFAALPILYGNVVQRPHFPYAAGASGIAVVMHWSAMATGGLPVEVAIAAGIEFLTVAAVTLVAVFLIESELRRAYLRSLRGEINTDRLSHSNDELRQLSHLDTLTGIANRRWLEAHLDEMADRSARAAVPLAVLMVDVDHFKGFNDHYGHPEGDRCLKMVAAVARDQVRRKDDLIGRFGGEEFLVILPGTDLLDATKVAERIRHAIESMRLPHARSDVADTVTVSIGVAAGRVSDGISTEELVRAADNALYEAKRLGRNRIHASAPGFTALETSAAPRPRRISIAAREAAE